ncbi:4'-phosphopantetheinyl transferase family protein [Foetidibacter luteolus]|uniref:4'-phosphopantetheinyl transferase family protein n=1 Tax=Foetidibacter luteolus TaxID=2608880 RepID=UPI00129B4824|nr:4'-phosphopantetheinyl transferase superfamily protein [Foetidibacter luteolus]
MALFYQHNINDTTRLGIWYIDEPEEFFAEKVPLQRGISHPHKRLQHLAGRYLLKHLFPDFPYHEILIADTRKPYLPYEQYHFSISHCGNYAAAVVSSSQRVGIDIEIPSDKVARIQHKFLDVKERSFVQEYVKSGLEFNAQLLTVLWSCKEAIFKWYSLGEVDFKKHIQLNGPVTIREDENVELPFIFCKHETETLQVNAHVFSDIVLSWVVT